MMISLGTKQNEEKSDYIIRDNEMPNRKRVACQIFGKAGLLFQKRHRKLELDIQGLTGRNSLFPQPVFRISIFSVTMKREVLRIDHNFRTGLFN